MWVKKYTHRMLSMAFFIYLKKGPVCASPSGLFFFLTRDEDLAGLAGTSPADGKTPFLHKKQREVDAKGYCGR